MVEIPLYENICTVIEPTVTFSEYFNAFLPYFNLKNFYENPGLDNSSSETNFKEVVPDYMILDLLKK